MSTTRSPRNKLLLTTNDSAGNDALMRRQLRDGTAATGTVVLSTRISRDARANVQALARRMGMTPSRMLGAVVVVLSESDVAEPTPDQIKMLRAVCAALGIDPDSDADTIRGALAAVLDAAPQPEPARDPLEGAAEPLPAKLSRTFTTSHGVVTLSASEIKTCEESGAKPEAYAENKAIRDAARHARARRRR